MTLMNRIKVAVATAWGRIRSSGDGWLKDYQAALEQGDRETAETILLVWLLRFKAPPCLSLYR